LIRTIGRMPARGDEVAAAVSSEGTGCAAVLKEIARELRAQLAESMHSCHSSCAPDALMTADHLGISALI